MMNNRMKLLWTAAMSAAVAVLIVLGAVAALDASRLTAAFSAVEVDAAVTDERGEYAASFRGAADSVWQAGGAELSESNRYLSYAFTVYNGGAREVTVRVIGGVPGAMHVTPRFSGGGETCVVGPGDSAEFTVRLEIADFSASFSGAYGFTLDFQ